jgi:hypothetical protein
LARVANAARQTATPSQHANAQHSIDSQEAKAKEAPWLQLLYIPPRNTLSPPRFVSLFSILLPYQAFF